MKWNICIFLICLSVAHSVFLKSLRDNLLSYFRSLTESDVLRSNGLRDAEEAEESEYGNPEAQELRDDTKQKLYEFEESQHPWKDRQDNADIDIARNRSTILNKVKAQEMASNMQLEDNSNRATTSIISKHFYHMDPVLNMVKRKSFRRADSDDTDTQSSSSSLEMKYWKDEFRELWLHKKYEALNASLPAGDAVNVVAARPWGVSCGDPDQHDMPWGTCMLAMECEAEFRIYRGDYFCGRTRFVCCALKLTTYDMYQGFDISLEDKSMSTDSAEKRDQKKTSKEKRKSQNRREKKKLRKDRENRKKKIKRKIKKIVKEIRKILNKQYKNGTKERKKKTKQLSKFLKDLKKQYKADRESVKNLHEKTSLIIDTKLWHKLMEIKKMNDNFVKNETFREIIVNGTITKQGARMLVQAYPELSDYLDTRSLRRTGVSNNDDDYLEYDIEYGYLYY